LPRIKKPIIRIGLEVLSDLHKALGQEWLVANGLGGYASSTVLNINTRKFHGMLVAAYNPPVDRHVALSKVDEEVQIGDSRFALGSNEFRGIIFPDGYRRLRSFTLTPFPTFLYEASGLFLKKTIFMPYGENATVIRYEVINGSSKSAKVNFYPLVAMRHFYDVVGKEAMMERLLLRDEIENGVRVTHTHTGEQIILASTRSSFTQDQDLWIENLYFRVDDERGESCFDNLYQPGFFSLEVSPGARAESYMVAAANKSGEEEWRLLRELDELTVKRLYRDEVMRRGRILENFYLSHENIKSEEWLSWLLMAADSFIVIRRSVGRRSIIAGYHWFEDWGRDALISLPGLTLIPKRFYDAEEILLTFKEYCQDGLIPSHFPDRTGDKPAYDSADTSLWFINAVFQFLKYTGNYDFVRRQLWESMKSIVNHYIKGTRFGISMDKDGLIIHGPRLTWMDVQIYGTPVTPRSGKAVEVQALWFNSLRIMETLAAKFNQQNDRAQYKMLAEKVKSSFNKAFWNSDGRYLLDCIGAEGVDTSLRPNQIFAVSLDFPILDEDGMVKVVDVVRKELWGRYGLRTLAKNDPRYIGTYGGEIINRERAYHNGTVWAWLTGSFVTAFLKVKRRLEAWRKYALHEFLEPLFNEEIYRAGLGTISEIFDGDPPHTPRGCISQAWSIAEPLRAYVEDILLERPPFEESLLGYNLS